MNQIKPKDLKWIQQKTGYSIQEMADTLSIPRSTYKSWLYGRRNIPEMQQAIFSGWIKSIKNEKWKHISDAIMVGSMTYVAYIFLNEIFNDKNKDNEQNN